MSTDAPVLLWFRDDLRLADHAALHAAIQTGGPVLPVFILDDQSPWPLGGAARWWLHHSLTALQQSLTNLGTTLTLRRGEPAAKIAEIAHQTGATEIFSQSPATTMFHPDSIRTKTGGPYSVFTPFANACLARGGPNPPLPAPTKIRPAPPPKSDRLEDWDLRPTKPDWAAGLRATWTPGEPAALIRAQTFIRQTLENYATARDHPSIEGTSMLSPHLRFGEISAAQLWHTAAGHPAAKPFLRQLLWREFCAHLLWHHPTLPETPLKPEFAKMPWREDRQALAAWQTGQTGVPIVDAGMRQLWQTGWMHNRVRMIVASFLTKHLMLPWQTGEAWFWDTLVDAELANNAANWQWVAGSGADAAPYFRIFNPVLQSRKFDANGDYLRHFVPELANLDGRYIHAPWDAPPAVLGQAGVTLGKTYPNPIVDLTAGRIRALDAYAQIRSRPIAWLVQDTNLSK